MIKKYQESEKQSQGAIKEFVEDIEVILKTCYLAIYYYCKKGRSLTTNETEEMFSIDRKQLTSFISDTYRFCKTNGSPLSDSNGYTNNMDFVKNEMPGFIELDSKFLDSNQKSYNFSNVIMDKRKIDVFHLCKQIVEDGLANTEIPYIHFAELISIDKIEIENYRHIYNLMSNKIKSFRNEKQPLSFCVFGKPGSGKSFGIKQILKCIDPLKKCEILTFNLSQMNSVDDLYNAFIKSSDYLMQGRMPIVFWDEFDSVFQGKKYGWLKYFLAPMEDGEYYANNAIHNVGSCIYVFAGSDAKSWNEFVNLSTSQNQSSSNNDFSKISDFISRISGYIDVLGPNCDPNDSDAYKLRRAVFIRKKIEAKYGIGTKQPFTIDEDVLRALINVNHYKHGNRSLDRLINQFRINSGESLHIKSYCIPNQLELYVDKEDFKKYLNNNSSS